MVLIFLITSFTMVMAYENETNFFKVEQKNGRWRFIDPDGNPFFSSGICDLKAKGNYAPDLGYSPYYRNIIDLYCDEETWANVTYDRIVSWGFNTIGAWSDSYIKNTGLPYAVHLSLSRCNRTVPIIEDYFSEEWIEKVEEICRNVVSSYSNDSNILGYFLANELRWGPEFADLEDVFAEYCKMPWNSSGKIFLVQFLNERYNGDICNFNRAWRTYFGSFDEIYNVSSLGIFPKTIKAKKDRADFTYLVAEQFFKVGHDAVRRYDKNHLILGACFLAYGTPKEVVKACLNYTDVITINHYPVRWSIALTTTPILKKMFNFVSTFDMLQEYYDVSDKPIMITEIHFRAWDSGLPNTKLSPFLHPVSLTQNMRANRFYRFMSRFIEKPYSIGYHWYSYMDQPWTGRADGENSNIGIVNILDEPYEPLVNKMTAINRLAQDYVK